MKQLQGFVAGTLIHTDKGLVPIEQIKVGDMVLSRPENDPDALNEYKRVVRTFKSAEKKRVVQIKFWDNDNQGEMCLFATEDHPFWVDELGGWTLLKDFPRCEEVIGSSLRNIHNDLLTVCNTPWIPLLKTTVEDIALSSNVWQWEAGCGFSELVDFRDQRPLLVVSREGNFLVELLSDSFSPNEHVKYLSPSEEDPEFIFYNDTLRGDLSPVDDGRDNAYTTYVYNIEVEDFHTYYVGKAGIWVHHTNGYLTQ